MSSGGHILDCEFGAARSVVKAKITESRLSCICKFSRFAYVSG